MSDVKLTRRPTLPADVAFTVDAAKLVESSFVRHRKTLSIALIAFYFLKLLTIFPHYLFSMLSITDLSFQLLKES